MLDSLQRIGKKVVGGVKRFGEKHAGKLAVVGGLVALDQAVREKTTPQDEKVTIRKTVQEPAPVPFKYPKPIPVKQPAAAQHQTPTKARAQERDVVAEQERKKQASEWHEAHQAKKRSKGSTFDTTQKAWPKRYKSEQERYEQNLMSSQEAQQYRDKRATQSKKLKSKAKKLKRNKNIPRK